MAFTKGFQKTASVAFFANSLLAKSTGGAGVGGLAAAPATALYNKFKKPAADAAGAAIGAK